MTNNLSPALPASVRWFAIIVGTVSLLGTTLIWAQGVLMPIWPVLLKPFNARFFGATYFGIIAYIFFLLRANRHDPGRLVITLSFVFSGMIAFITLFHLNDFIWERRMGTTGWFIFYFLPTFWAAFYLWKYRNTWNVGERHIYSAWLQTGLRIQAGVSIVYALALVASPQWATAFWPWAVDSFHARAYSGIFLALGLGAWILQKGAGKQENLAMGWGQCTLGVMVLSGFWYTDHILHKVDWAAAGTLLWLGYFIALTVMGISLLLSIEKKA